MNVIDLADPELRFDPDDAPGFRAGMLRPGGEVGAMATGMTLYELPPGEAICPYHYEYGEEEWLVVLSGSVTVRHPAGEEVLRPLQAMFFATGPDGAHGVRNHTAEPARVLMFSDVVTPTATAYPDSGKVGIWTGIREENLLVRRESAVDYYDGERGDR